VADNKEVCCPVPWGRPGRHARPLLGPARPAEPDSAFGGRKIVHLRWKQRLGPAEIADRLNTPSSTVHAVLVRCRINGSPTSTGQPGDPIRRYEHAQPGDLIHVDVKKMGKISDGGGRGYVGRQQDDQDRGATAAPTGSRSNAHDPHIGTCYCIP
jgi:hypothetical protein